MATNNRSVATIAQERERLQGFSFEGALPGSICLYWVDQMGQHHAFAATTSDQVRKIMRALAMEKLEAPDFSVLSGISAWEHLGRSRLEQEHILMSLREARKDMAAWFGQLHLAGRQGKIALLFIREFANGLFHALEIRLKRLLEEPRLVWEVESLPNNGGIYRILLEGIKEGER